MVIIAGIVMFNLNNTPLKQVAKEVAKLEEANYKPTLDDMFETIDLIHLIFEENYKLNNLTISERAKYEYTLKYMDKLPKEEEDNIYQRHAKLRRK